MKIKIKVKPNSGKQEIIKKDNFYLIKLKSPPENNKANIELLKLLKKYFGKEVRIKRGFTSKNKIVEIN
ncbi:DUF167 domain-containing protein [Candidatus Pacearchaeota archaeon]|nr:DUF167 domain-containing protein [Candidatus Pacearchaeota archaeon]